MSVYVSDDDGASWDAHTFTSATPTSSSYILADTFTLINVSATTKIKFECTTNNKGIHLKNIKLTGVVDVSAPAKPLINNVTPTTELGQSFDVSAEVSTL